MVILLPMLVMGQSKEADKYFNKGNSLYQSGDYYKALQFYTKCKVRDRIELDQSSQYYYRADLGIANCYNQVSFYYYLKGDTSIATKYAILTLKIRTEVLGKDQVDYKLLLINQANVFASIGRYDNAIECLSIALKATEKVLGKNVNSYFSIIDKLCQYNELSGNYTETIRLMQIVLNQWYSINGADSIYAILLYKNATLNSTIKKYDAVIPLANKSNEICKLLMGENHPLYLRTLVLLVEAYYHIEKYDDAIKAGKLATDYIEKHHYIDSYYSTLFNNLAWCYSAQGKYSEAITTEIKALNLCKEGEPNYIEVCSSLALFYHYNGEDFNGLKYGKEAISLSKKGEEEYSSALNNLALCYSGLGNHQQALNLELMAIDNFNNTSDKDSSEYASLLNNIALFHFRNGDYPKAIEYIKQALNIRKLKLGENHSSYAESLSSLATFYASIGNYEKAIRLGSKAMHIQKQIFGLNSIPYAISLNNVGQYYLKIKKFASALPLAMDAVETTKELVGNHHPDYSTALNNLSVVYSSIGDSENAIKYCNQALNIQREVLGEDHPSYATSLNNLALYNSDLGNYTEAKRLGYQALEIIRKVLGDEHPYYDRSLGNLAYYYFKSGNYDESAKLYKQCFERTKTFVLKNFASMIEKERANFWSINSQFFSDRLPYCAYKHPTPTFATIAYNGQLLSKGLLLNAELEIHKLIEKSGDKEMEQRYYKIRSDRALLDKLYQVTPGKRSMSVDSHLAVIDKEERLLVESSKELGDYTRNLSIEWQDVQKKLSNKDIAIEFASVNSNEYIALILKQGMSSPEVVKLSFSENDLANCYQSPSLYNVIWKPIEKYLNGVEIVYFAPSGKFYTCAIEYLPDNSGNIFSKKYNVYRLSSTRELVLKKEVNSNKKASVFGGIVYDLTKDDWQNRNTIAQENVFRDIPNISDSRGLVFNYLPHTVRESNEIVNILRGVNYQVSLGIAKNATEESFKKLSGSGIKILHIATHGYYEPENKEKNIPIYYYYPTNKIAQKTAR